jgi:hypothetical protein
MWPGQKLDLGHAVDVVAGGFGGPRRLEHSHCNQGAGSRVGSARRKARIAKTRTPAEQQAHDQRIAKQMRREAKRAWAALEQPGRDWLSGRVQGVSYFSEDPPVVDGGELVDNLAVHAELVPGLAPVLDGDLGLLAAALRLSGLVAPRNRAAQG